MLGTKLKEGMMFAGDFTVVRDLGEGGMGAVYQVHQQSTNAQRALKLMRPELLGDHRLLARFKQEAVVSASIASAHVVDVITAGVDEPTGIPYIVMELLDGEDLADMIRRRGPLPWPEAREVLSQLCHGLAAAHALGIVHRDLKPANIMVTRSHRADAPFTVKILDFGIAKIVAQARGSSMVTQSLGSPLFMAPEQADARSVVSQATDVWALGLVTFYLLAGRNYWVSGNVDNASLKSMIVEIITAPIVPASQRMHELGADPSLLPPGFDLWLGRCLQRDVALRYPSAREAWNALQLLLPAPAQAPTPTPGLAASTPPPPTQLFTPVDLQAVVRDATPVGSVTQPSMPLNTGGWRPSTGALAMTNRPLAISQAGKRGGRRMWPAMLGVAFAVLSLVGVAAGLWWWAQEKVVYCGHVESRNAVPVCLVEVEPEAVANREHTVRLVRAKGRVLRAEVINSLGALRNNESDMASWHYRYNDDGEVESCTIQDRLGKIVNIIRYPDRGHAEVLGRNDKRRTFHDDRYTMWERTVDGRGHLTEERYYAAPGLPATDSEGAFGYAYKYNEEGFEFERTVLGPDGAPAFDDNHVQTTARFYDKHGRLVRIEFREAGGKRLANGEGCHGFEYEHDAHGNITKVVCVDDKGAPATWLGGYTGVVKQYRDGRLTEQRYIDADGKTVAADGIARIKFRYDERGHLESKRFFGTDGRRSLNRDYVAGVAYKRDESGLATETVYLGKDDRPVYHKDRMAILRSKYDRHGNAVKVSFFGPDGKPVYSTDGYASRALQYTSSQDVKAVSYFDVRGKPILREGGYAAVKYERDVHGRILKETFLGTDGKRLTNANWVAVVKHRYDERGDRVETRYFGADDSAVFHKEGYAGVNQTYNNRGVVVEVAYVDTEGKPAWSRSDVGRIGFEVNAFGEKVAERYHDLEGRLIPDTDGVALMKFERDGRGRELTRRFFDGSRKPVIARGPGFSVRTTKYNPNGSIAEYRFLDTNDKPLSSKGKYAVHRYAYNARGDVVEERYLDHADKLTEGPKGVAVVQIERDERGSIIAWKHLGTDSQPVKSAGGMIAIRTKKDERDLQIEWRYFDGEGKPVQLSDGYWMSRAEYDERGRKVASFVYDEAGQPVVMNDGWASIRFEFDERGHIQRKRYFLADGSPRTDRYSQVNTLHDERGLEVEFSLLDAAGAVASGYLTVKRSYNERGDLIEEAVFKGDKPGTNAVGVSRWTYQRDARGRAEVTSYFNADGRPTIHEQERAAVVRVKYDERGTMREKALFDTRGKRTRLYRYDSAGDLIK